MAWTTSDPARSYRCNVDLLTFLRKRKGWTQAELAQHSGYSKRLICKAESGGQISAQAIDDLAESLSTAEDRIYPEGLISDPVALAKEYIAAEYACQEKVVDAMRHFLDDEIVIRLAGDPAKFPFAGEHRGIAGVERLFEAFFSVLEAPVGHDPTPWYQFLGQGNEVVVWGKTWIHPIGKPMKEPLDLVHRMKFRRGKLIEVDVVFDSLEGSRRLQGGELIGPEPVT